MFSRSLGQIVLAGLAPVLPEIRNRLQEFEANGTPAEVCASIAYQAAFLFFVQPIDQQDRLVRTHGRGKGEQAATSIYAQGFCRFMKWLVRGRVSID